MLSKTTDIKAKMAVFATDERQLGCAPAVETPAADFMIFCVELPTRARILLFVEGKTSHLGKDKGWMVSTPYKPGDPQVNTELWLNY